MKDVFLFPPAAWQMLVLEDYCVIPIWWKQAIRLWKMLCGGGVSMATAIKTL